MSRGREQRPRGHRGSLHCFLRGPLSAKFTHLQARGLWKCRYPSLTPDYWTETKFSKFTQWFLGKWKLEKFGRHSPAPLGGTEKSGNPEDQQASVSGRPQGERQSQEEADLVRIPIVRTWLTRQWGPAGRHRQEVKLPAKLLLPWGILSPTPKSYLLI